MDAIEKRARELVMAEIPDLAKECFGYQGMTVVNLHVVMRILRAALTPPEGYVLVPVELSPGMARVLGCRACLNTHDLQALWVDLLAARPEVP
ncbi:MULTISPECIES: hypothetical protein [unclassified Stenotrophomonas maltophilia group]|uniref:hypothetical protein n=1 Tax=unclassified Stenotrophomonas maltophilia group TaxID=2961925 RepID=UPI003BF7BA5E